MSDYESYYGVLQVDAAAEPEVIESAYHRLARKYHPDVNARPGASARMAAINRAYETLRHPGRRAIYDRELRRAPDRGTTARWTSSQLPGLLTSADESRLAAYQQASEQLAAQAARSLRDWSARWAEEVDLAVSGDLTVPGRLDEASERCIAELSECLASWERLNPPPPAQRIAELGAACLKLQLALLRGALTFTARADYSVLQPLAGLAERIRLLTVTITAEANYLSRPGKKASPPATA